MYVVVIVSITYNVINLMLKVEPKVNCNVIELKFMCACGIIISVYIHMHMYGR